MRPWLRWILIALMLLAYLLGALMLLFRGARADDGGGTAIPTPAPPPGAKTVPVEIRPLPEPEPPGGSGPGGPSPDRETRVVQETRHYHSHQIYLSAETVSDALDAAFRSAARGDMEALNGAIGQSGGAAAAALQTLRGGIQGDLEGAARSVFPVAAGLAVPLFLLRLALYHWARLIGEEDSPLRVASDWIAALIWAVAAGPVAARVAAIGFALAARIPGNPQDLFIPPQLGLNVIGMAIFGPLLNLLLGLGYIAAVAAMLWALAAGYGILYILAILGPVAGVARAVPHLRWLSGLWLKGVVLASLLPVAAGAAIRALGMASGAIHLGSGLTEAVVRLVWAWGAVGFLFTMAGAAARFSAGGAMEMVGGVVRAAKGIIGMAILAAGTGGAGLAVGAAGAGALSSGAAAGAGMDLVRQGLQEEALGRVLGLPGLAAQGAWHRELGRLWVREAAAVQTLETMRFFEERVAAPLERQVGDDPTGEEGWMFRQFLHGYRQALREAGGGWAPPGADEAFAARWQNRLWSGFREARGRLDAPMVGGETLRTAGYRQALRDLLDFRRSA